MRAAFSVWNERIAPVFDVSQKLLVLEIEEGGKIARNTELFLDDDPVRKVAKLADLRIQTLVCGAISRPLAEMAYSSGIDIIPFVAGNIEEVIKIYLEDGLPNPDMAMPGYCGRRERFRGGKLFCEGFRKNKFSNDKDVSIEKRRRKMPRGDGTGPQGKGPGTGRGMGRCGVKGSQRPAGQPGQGQGTGTGAGQGRGTGAGAGQGRERGPGRRKNK